MEDLAKKPSPERMRRGTILIETLRDCICLYDDGSKDSRNPFVRYSNWRTDYGDYAEMISIARRIAKREGTFVVEASGYGGEAGSQFITIGHIEHRGQPDWSKILERAVENIYKREQQRGISQEEIEQRISQAKEEDLDKVVAEIERSLPRSRDNIRGDLIPKWLKYLSSKTG